MTQKKSNSKKIVADAKIKNIPTNRSRCNTYLVYIFSYPVVWTFSCVFSSFSHLGNHYSAVIHPRVFFHKSYNPWLEIKRGWRHWDNSARPPFIHYYSMLGHISFLHLGSKSEVFFSKSFYKYDVAYCILIKLRRFCGKFYRNSKFKHNMIILMTSYSIHTYTTCSSFITVIIRK